MSARKAKALRKQAREETVGKPAVCYVEHLSDKVLKSTRFFYHVPTIELGECTRRVYKRLKRERK